MEKTSFDKLASDIHKRLTDEYSFLSEWTVNFDNAKRRAGICRADKKEISISLCHINNNAQDVVLDTLLHEFAHAIAHELYGEIGHGAKWKSVALKLGATPKATGKFSMPAAPWKLVTYCKESKTVDVVASRYRKNKNIKYYYVKGKPNTQGELYYLCTKQLEKFETGMIGFAQLNFIQ
ncbi:SprT-like domain-containing protein [Aliikangiella coralliicola]|uniref:SprT family zinc-dependent metalloprotease n=1 Tax=Aliikangiella coralliicola TaxID=2592383 RepID=A0A545TZW1_9GAMM|nr:SprT-like domain-containing protein [Aliikangiella coralliicola]TQV82756.1 SprT family zinc-dependent metalloprotease [Aliikangiella coralliicola]